MMLKFVSNLKYNSISVFFLTLILVFIGCWLVFPFKNFISLTKTKKLPSGFQYLISLNYLKTTVIFIKTHKQQHQ